MPLSPDRRPTTDRRRFLGGLAAAGGVALAAPALAQAQARVLVVGGGIAGASLAARLARSAPGLAVTLATAAPRHTTGSFSNQYLAGFRSLASITFDYQALSRAAGFRLVVDRVSAIDRTAREARLAGGGRLGYERLALAPGVAFKDSALVGYDVFARELMPHAYQGGFQTFLLKRRLAALPPGGTFAIAPPAGPYPGALAPYERAGMAALALSRVNPRAKVLILDAAADFPLRAAFLAQWRAAYGDRIEWLSSAETGGGLARVEAQSRTLVTGGGDRLQVDVANVIPAQRAGAIALQAALTDDAGWAPIEPATARSRVDPTIFVLGDAAQAEGAPKTAGLARAHAAAAAAQIQADLTDGAASPAVGGPLAVLEYASTAPQRALRRLTTLSPGGAAAIATAPDAAAKELRENAIDANVWYTRTVSAAFR